MTEENKTLLIIGVCVLFLTLVIVYFVLRFLKGSLKLSLPQTNFSEGETISGSFDLIAKKHIEGNGISVQLTATKETRRYDGKRQHTDRSTIYQDEVLIEEAKVYPAGYSKRYEFEITAPKISKDNPKQSETMKTLISGLEVLRGRDTRIQWDVSATLDAKGIDLTDSINICVNTNI